MRIVSWAVLVTPPAVAVMVTVVSCTTRAVVTRMLLVVVFPAGTVTDVLTGAKFVLLLESWTARPPEGAGPLRLTCPPELWRATTLVGSRVMEDSTGGTTVNWMVLVTPRAEAAMVTVVDCATGTVVTAKLAVIAPAGTVTDTGTVAAAVLLLLSWTTRPNAGA